MAKKSKRLRRQRRVERINAKLAMEQAVVKAEEERVAEEIRLLEEKKAAELAKKKPAPKK